MIRVHRCDEPPALKPVRDTELVRVRAIALDHNPSSKEVDDKYTVVKHDLWKCQGYKCSYCESREQAKRNDVEHYRPKSRAIRSPGSDEKHGYWWLAWTWENLLFSCRNCNQSPAKLDKFPLEQGSEALTAEQQPPGLERHLLLDPATEDGCLHIEFRLTQRGDPPVERWVPVPRNGSDKGDWTIMTCLLDRPDLLDLYSLYVEDEVMPEITEVQKALQTGIQQTVTEAWVQATRRLLYYTNEYVGLARDVLVHNFPEDV